jgi:hypothetical protein
MNKVRREQLKEVIKTIEMARDMVESVRDEESDAWESMPENLQDSTRGSEMQDNIDALDEILSDIEDVIDSIGSLV